VIGWSFQPFQRRLKAGGYWSGTQRLRGFRWDDSLKAGNGLVQNRSRRSESFQKRACLLTADTFGQAKGKPGIEFAIGIGQRQDGELDR